VATPTPRYNLLKPLIGETYNVQTSNDNYDKIDTALPSFLPGAKPFGHMGRTQGFQVVNTAAIQKVIFVAAQQLKGGVTFDSASSSLIVPVTGTYRVTIKGYATGPSGYVAGFYSWINDALPAARASITFWKADSQDYQQSGSVTIPLNAGNKVQLGANTSVAGAGSTWGTSGYDGAWLELEWMDS
jgi:hypothetical protein